MGSKSICIWGTPNNNVASNNVGGGIGKKTAWFSQPIDKINSILNEELPAKFEINSTSLWVHADYDLSGIGNVYIRYGFGGTSSIDQELFAAKKMSTDRTPYPASNVNLDILSYFSSKSAPCAISKSNGDNLTVSIYSSNIANKTFYVGWAILTVHYTAYYDITIQANDSSMGTVSGGGTYAEDTTASLYATPNAGYYIAYWEYNGTKISNSENSTSLNTDAILQNRTYKVVFAPITYNITYNLNGGTVSSANPTTYYVNSNNFTLNNPTKVGYDFTGWTGSNGTTTQKTVTISKGSTGDKSYTANYVEKRYNIQMNGNGANGGSTTGHTNVSWLSTMALYQNGFTRTGYTFTGWNTKADGTGSSFADKQEVNGSTFNAANGSTITLYAQWNPNNYTIKFDANTGIGSMSNLSMVYDTAKNLTANTFTKAGHTFTGWNTKADGSGTHYADKASVKNLAASGTATLYAEWEINKYSITWKDWDGSELEKKDWNYDSTPSYSGSIESLNYETDEAFYDFDGWTPNIVPVTAPATYTATYLKTIKTYTVVWKNWDGTVLETDANVKYGTTPSFDKVGDPTRESDDPKYFYVFNGWDTAITPVTGHITYTATYTINIHKYTVTWQDWDGSILEIDRDVVYDTPPSYDQEDPVRASTERYEYPFIGWKTEVNDVPVDEENLEGVRGNVTYTAVYEEKARMYKFDVNINPSSEYGMVSGYVDSEYEYGSELTLMAIPYEGYRFVSWSYIVDGALQTAMRNPIEISILEDLEITVLFEEKPNVPIYINETQLEAVYINPDTLTIIYVVPDEVVPSTSLEETFSSVDGWNFVVSNVIPSDGYKVEEIYIDDLKIYE